MTLRCAIVRLSAASASLLYLLPAAVICADTLDANASRLFDSQQILELRLSSDFEGLRRERDQEVSLYHPAVLEYVAQDGSRHSIDITVKVRGQYRIQEINCQYPLLMLDFRDSDVDRTLFAGQTQLPLVTHCKKVGAYEQYVVMEYLVYRVYNSLTERSLRVRPAQMTYVDKTGASATGFGFFVEHFDRMAERLSSRIVKLPRFDALEADPYEIGLLDVFQYMIGNIDWSVIYQHNIILLQDEAGQITAVPYDFDWAGIIGATYAHGRQRPRREFRGFCRADDELGPVFDAFLEQRPTIQALYDTEKHLEEKYRKRALVYYDRFYTILESPSQRQRKIVESCRPPPR